MRNVPIWIYDELNRRAVRNSRSLSSEVIAIISEFIDPQELDVDSFLREVRELRESVPGYLTDDFLYQAKVDGRP